MKTWFAKFRISNALDADRPSRSKPERNIAKSPGLRRFAENMAILDDALKNKKPLPTAPASLHSSILRAVRSARAAEANAHNRAELLERLIPASALGLLVLMAALGALNSSKFSEVATPASPSVAIVGSALDTGNQIVSAVPNAAVSPLSDEMAKLKTDLTNAQSYLLASVP